MIQLDEIRKKKGLVDVSLGFEEELEGKWMLLQVVMESNNTIYDAIKFTDILMITDSKSNFSSLSGITIISKMEVFKSKYISEKIRDENFELFVLDESLKLVFDDEEQLECFININPDIKVVPGSLLLYHEAISIYDFLKNRRIYCDFDTNKKYILFNDAPTIFEEVLKRYNVFVEDEGVAFSLYNFKYDCAVLRCDVETIEKFGSDKSSSVYKDFALGSISMYSIPLSLVEDLGDETT